MSSRDRPSRLDLKAVLRDIFAEEGTVTVTALWNETGWTVRIESRLEEAEADWTCGTAALDIDALADWLARTFAALHPATPFARKYAGLTSRALDDAIGPGEAHPPTRQTDTP